jgi:hypothetical protein
LLLLLVKLIKTCNQILIFGESFEIVGQLVYFLLLPLLITQFLFFSKIQGHLLGLSLGLNLQLSIDELLTRMVPGSSLKVKIIVVSWRLVALEVL